MDIKTIDRIVEKWGRVTPGRAQDYKIGIEHPRRDWADATLKAEATYTSAMTQAVSERRWSRGVEAAGTRKWHDKTLAKGPARWSQGVGLAEADFKAGFAPYHDLLKAIILPPRGPKGDPANLERVRIIAESLHELKRRIG